MKHQGGMAKQVLYDSPFLQDWPIQMYPPVNYVFPPHRKKIWKKDGIMSTPLVIPPGDVESSIVRFDFDEPQHMGLPCFDSKKQLRRDARWGRYLRYVYGELPDTYPLCVSQFSRMYSSLASLLNISLPVASYDICEQDGAQKRLRSWSMSVEPTWMVYLLHYKVPRDPLPHQAWVEVTHRSRTWLRGFERQGMWFGVAGGTGVWFNTGRTIAFREHHEAFQFFNAHWETDMAMRARHEGYDTVQFIYGDSQRHPCCHKLNLTANCFGIELMSTRLVGNYACGGVNSTFAFRSGWNAQRPCRCTEDNIGKTNGPYVAGYINCMGTASHCASTNAKCATRMLAARHNMRRVERFTPR